jgi:cellulose synthase/poly-beta-1,6-N-acetylglucosamine synthase-like glycosyltransferase
VKASFIIPVKNDARNLERCLASIARLDRPGIDVEVLVIDNGSVDGSADVARRAGARVLSLPGRRVAALRNEGVREAAGDILAFVDADHEIAPGWLFAAVETLEGRSDTAGVGSLCWPPPSPTWVQRMYDALRGRPSGVRDVEWLGAGNLAVRREAFEAVGGFDASLEACEDVDLSNRLRRAGWRLVSDSRLRSVHFGDPATLAAVFRGELWRGRGNLRVTLRGPLSFRSLATAVIPLAQLLAIAAAVIGALWSPGAAGWTGMVAIVLVCALPALRAGRMLRRLETPGWREAVQAYAVAFAYDIARALSPLLRTGHRRRPGTGASG